MVTTRWPTLRRLHPILLGSALALGCTPPDSGPTPDLVSPATEQTTVFVVDESGDGVAAASLVVVHEAGLDRYTTDSTGYATLIETPHGLLVVTAPDFERQEIELSTSAPSLRVELRSLSARPQDVLVHVRDSSDQSIADATVILINKSAGENYTASTNQFGFASFEVTGFDATTRAELRVLTESTEASRDFFLEPSNPTIGAIFDDEIGLEIDGLTVPDDLSVAADSQENDGENVEPDLGPAAVSVLDLGGLDVEGVSPIVAHTGNRGDKGTVYVRIDNNTERATLQGLSFDRAFGIAHGEGGGWLGADHPGVRWDFVLPAGATKVTGYVGFSPRSSDTTGLFELGCRSDPAGEFIWQSIFRTEVGTNDIVEVNVEIPPGCAQLRVLFYTMGGLNDPDSPRLLFVDPAVTTE